MKVLFEKRIPLFPDKVLLSKKRRPKYIKKSPDGLGEEYEFSRLPKKYSNGKFKFTKDHFLINIETGEKQVENPIVAGKPKYLKISGQDIWSGVNYHSRSKISKHLKQFFYEEFVKEMNPVQVTDYPIGVEMVFYDVIDGADLNNQEFIYKKCLGDALCGNVEYEKTTINGKDKFMPNYIKYPKKIKDDSKECIQEYLTRFVPIQSHEERSLLIRIYKL